VSRSTGIQWLIRDPEQPGLLGDAAGNRLMLQALSERGAEPRVLGRDLGLVGHAFNKTTIMPTTRSPIEEATS
jgi:hypothetical protein